MERHQNGFALVEILVIALIIGVIGGLGLVIFAHFHENIHKIASSATISSNNITTPAQQSAASNAGSLDGNTVSIQPQNLSDKASADAFTAVLPTGWSIQKVYEDYDIVKTTSDGKRYLISSFITNENRSFGQTFMQNDQVSSGDIIKTVKTSKGTEVSIVETPESLTLTACKPTGDDCYLSLNGMPLFIHLYIDTPGVQSAPEIDYSSDTAKGIVNDFELIAESLNI